MSVIQIFGKMGSCKTHFATFYALHMANKYRKKIVSSYLFHPDSLLRYCRYMRYHWLLENLSRQEPLIYFCDIEKGGIDYLLSVDKSVIIFDESSLYTPSRQSGSKTTKNSIFHKELTQIRHRKNHLLVIAQDPSQIDLSIKKLSEEVVFCASLCPEDKYGVKKMIYKKVHLFYPDDFEIWFSNARLRRSPVKTSIMRKKCFSGLLKQCDIELFSVYPSFDLVHEADPVEGSFLQDSKYKYIPESFDDCPKLGFRWYFIEPLPSIKPVSLIVKYCYTKMLFEYWQIAVLLKKKYIKNPNKKLYIPSSNKLYNKFIEISFALICLMFIHTAINYFVQIIFILFLVTVFLAFKPKRVS